MTKYVCLAVLVLWQPISQRIKLLVTWNMYIYAIPHCSFSFVMLSHAGSVNLLFPVLKCISELPSPFHQFGLLVELVSAWSLTWYQSPGSRVRVLVFVIYCKIDVAPLCVHVLTFSSPICVHVLAFSSLVCVHVLTFSSPVTRELGCWSV
jgi:hypothetical protein